MPLQFEGVTVHALPGPGQASTDTLQALLQPGPAAFQDPQPDVGAGLAEEREVDTEAVVLPGGPARPGEELLQELLAVSGQPVHDLGAAAGQRLRGNGRCL